MRRPKKKLEQLILSMALTTVVVGNTLVVPIKAVYASEVASTSLQMTYNGKSVEASEINKLVKQGISGAIQFIKDKHETKGYSYGDEWAIYSILRAGETIEEDILDAYYQSVVNQIKTWDEKQSVTNIERVALALSILGKDITNIEGINLAEKIYNSKGITSGSNAAAFALIALDAKNTTIPEDALWTREKLIAEVLRYQNPGDGGFGLFDTSWTDPDITAMIIQALAKYQDTNEDVKVAIEKGLGFLKSKSNSMNAETTAQVLLGLSAVGIDACDTDKAFEIKNKKIIIHFMDYYDEASGGFSSNSVNKRPTEYTTVQSLQGLSSYDRYTNGQTSYWDLTDIADNTPEVPDFTEEVNKATDGAIKYIKDKHATKGYSYGDEWAIYSVLRAGGTIEQDKLDAYYQSAVNKIKNWNGKESATEVERVALTLSLLGKDITNIEGINLAEKIYNSKGITSGSNAAAFALIALDAKNTTIPEDALWTREKLIAEVLRYQNPGDGGFGLFDTSWTDPDITAMIIQALAKYQDTNEDVKVAIEKGLGFLKSKSNSMNAETTAQVLLALSIIGVDAADVDKTFEIKNKNIIEHFMDHYDEASGGFSSNSANKRPTEYTTNQSLQALGSYQRYKNGQKSYWDLSDVETEKPEKTNTPPVINAEDVEIFVGDTFDERKDVTAYDEEDKDLTDAIDVVENTVDTSKAGVYKVIYKVVDSDNNEVTKEIKVTVKEKDQVPQEKTVKMGIYTDNEVIYEGTAFEYKKGDTAYTVLKRLLGDNVEATGSGETLYVRSINGLAEMDKGPQSGWVYSVNREIPQVGAGVYEVKPGDEIIWHYTLDFGNDITNSFGKFDQFINKDDKNDQEDKDDKNDQVDKDDKNDQEDKDDKNDQIDKDDKNDQEDKDDNKTDKVDVSEVKESTANWILSNLENPGYGDEWKILSLIRGNINVPTNLYETYYSNLENTLKEKKGVLHRVKYTEYSRVILTLTALGYDPTDVAGYNLVEKLFSFDNVSKQGLNGVIFALIALDTNNYEIKGTENSREMLINEIVSKQLADGGFNLSGTTGDVDMTAMAVQALAKHKEQPNVEAALEKALNFLSKSQLSTGGFGTSEGETAESSAQVLIALSALGIDVNDARFVKDGNTIVDAIMKFKVENEGFKHILSQTSSNDIATEQTLLALVALDRTSNGKTSLYDMSDVEKRNPENGGDQGNGGNQVNVGYQVNGGDQDNDGNQGNDEDQDNDGDTDDAETENPKTSDESMLPFVATAALATAGIALINRRKTREEN